MTDRAAPDWRIVPLGERPDTIPVLARALWALWGTNFPHKTVAVRSASLAARLDRDRIPTAIVALDPAGAPIGTASILLDDIETRTDLNPWLATVFVMPEMRGRGLGMALCAAMEAEAWRLGVSRLFLYTFDQRDFYSRLGWRDLETVDYNGQPTAIMYKERPR